MDLPIPPDEAKRLVQSKQEVASQLLALQRLMLNKPLPQEPAAKAPTAPAEAAEALAAGAGTAPPRHGEQLARDTHAPIGRRER